MASTNFDTIRQLILQGRVDEARAALELARRHPAQASAAHLLMAQSLVAKDRLDDAVGHARKACELARESPEVQFAAACLLAHAGHYAEAIDSFRFVVSKKPGAAEGWQYLGAALSRAASHASALPVLRKAFKLAPSPAGLRALAEAQFHAGFPDDALALWERIVAASPEDTDAILRLGETFNRLVRQPEAVALYLRALERQPANSDIWIALAQTYEDLGDRDRARDAYEHALELKPDWAFPLGGLLGVLRAKAPEARVQQAMALLDGPAASLDDPERALLGYELGKVFDGRGDHERAIDAWHDANAARRRVVGVEDPQDFERAIDETIRLYNTETFNRFRHLGSDDERFVFIVGMPRSGTTLTEQIIASHPLAHGAGELPEIQLLIRNLPIQADGSRLPWRELLQSGDPSWLTEAIALYARAAARNASPGSTRVVDKAPLNFFHLGLVALMFPRAHVIWCRRDPRDMGLSIYAENFALEEKLATDLGDIGTYIRLQERMMRHWQAALPLPILESNYEELVGDFEPRARRIIQFIGLDWDPACLAFHQSDRGVQTPSRWQVKQPIHNRSVGRWRHYAAHMAPLERALGLTGPD